MIKLGSNSIGKIYFGSNLIGKAYFGSNLVYSSGSSPEPDPDPDPGTETGYTVLGNPAITDGLMTIPGGQNGIITPLVFNPGSQVWEIQTRILYKFTRYTYIFRSCTSEGVGTFSVGMQMDNGNTMRFIYSTNGSSWVNNRGVTNTYTLDSWIWIKVGWNGSSYYHKFSLDGVNWTENSSALATVINQGSYILFGEPESNRYSQSTWDLNNTQISIGGKVRWKAIDS